MTTIQTRHIAYYLLYHRDTAIAAALTFARGRHLTCVFLQLQNIAIER